MAQSIGIIGGGIAGLSAACLLAKEGHRVTVLEKLEQAGGRTRTWEQNGFTFDMGPSWYWMPEVFEQFFNQFGKTTSDLYELKRLDPSYQVIYRDRTLKIPQGQDALLSLFESIEPGSGKKVGDFLSRAEVKYRTAMEHYIHKPSLSLREYLDMRIFRSFFKLSLFSSVKKEIGRATKNPYIQQILEFPVLFLGSIPSGTPALYSMMNYVDAGLGTWYPMGGMRQIAEAMLRIADEQGVILKTGEAVERVEVQDGALRTVHTSKASYTFDHVINAADYHHFEQEILPEEARDYDRKFWDKQTLSPSCLLFYVGIDRTLPNTEHHNLYFDAAFDQHADAIYNDPRWPEDPLFYMCVPSKTDPSVAPEGMENIFMLVPIAPGLDYDEALTEKYFDILCERVRQRTGVDIRQHLVVKRAYAVKDFVSDYHSFKGNAYGLANTLMQTAIFKPRMRSRKLRNLWYAGQLTVPGPGLPPAVISGQIAALEILKLSTSDKTNTYAVASPDLVRVQ